MKLLLIKAENIIVKFFQMWKALTLTCIYNFESNEHKFC